MKSIVILLIVIIILGGLLVLRGSGLLSINKNNSDNSNIVSDGYFYEPEFNNISTPNVKEVVNSIENSK